MDLPTMQKEVQDRLNKYRRLNSLVNSELFKTLYESSKDREGAVKFASDGDYDGLVRWIEREKARNINFMSVAQLRMEARLYGVQNYHLLMKEELIERIRACLT